MYPALLTRAPAGDTLFTPRFFVMCSFTFTVFLSAFQLLPTAPFRIRELGGIDVRVRSVSRLPDLRVGVLGAVDWRHRRSHRPPRHVLIIAAA